MARRDRRDDKVSTGVDLATRIAISEDRIRSETVSTHSVIEIATEDRQLVIKHVRTARSRRIGTETGCAELGERRLVLEDVDEISIPLACVRVPGCEMHVNEAERSVVDNKTWNVATKGMR